MNQRKWQNHTGVDKWFQEILIEGYNYSHFTYISVIFCDTGGGKIGCYGNYGAMHNFVSISQNLYKSVLLFLFGVYNAIFLYNNNRTMHRMI